MSENPYEPPLTDAQVVGVKSGNRKGLWTIAVCQKGMIVFFLIQLLAIVGQLVLVIIFFALPRLDVGVIQAASQILLLVLLAAGLVAMVFTILLSLNAYPTAMGILLATLALVPWIGLFVSFRVNGSHYDVDDFLWTIMFGLFVLFAVNGRATSILRHNGHKGGPLGTSLSKLKHSLQFDPASPHPNPLPAGEGATEELS
jgi:hypothetical protein